MMAVVACAFHARCSTTDGRWLARPGLWLLLPRFGRAGLVFVAAMVTTDGRQELRRRLICCLVVQLGGKREIIRRKRAQRLSHGRLRKLTGKFSASCGQFFVVVRS